MKPPTLLLLVILLLCLLPACSKNKSEYAAQADAEQNFEKYDTPPEVQGLITIQYPNYARDNGIQGKVVLQIKVLASGAVADIKVSKSDSEHLNDAAIDAVTKVSFKPALRDGTPVDAIIMLPISFKLN